MCEVKEVDKDEADKSSKVELESIVRNCNARLTQQLSRERGGVQDRRRRAEGKIIGSRRAGGRIPASSGARASAGT